jgi:major head protein|nr:MAG TPA: major capsid protein [Caudoviricetes sp.]DAS72574.1 MAG TPA: major capsid protein [Caudoviricetes sp.]DAT30378.1 MAG TPA: major capsid protein [Caudoviricetes sp.]DAT82958.1 MAG TPA: major capsid protein [Caudoviricetes sp.]DAV26522.1 MAG TPA: major capsid protein [Caudoviricetes sp.]
MTQTKIANLVNPQVMGDMVAAKLPKKLRVAPFATIDRTLVGVPGNTITVPSYTYIGDAEDVNEGVEAGVVTLGTSTKTATIKKAMKAVELTDEAVLSGYGDPVGNAENQLALAVASKIDNDALDALLATNTRKYDSKTKAISYDVIVDAIDLFEEEVNTEKVMFVNPKQVTTLRKDPNFISADKYPANVVMTGEIGTIANTRIVPTKKVKLDTTSAFYTCPIIKLTHDDETEQDTAALTVYLKRDPNVEVDRKSLKRTTEISIDEFYTVAVSDDSKVVLAEIKK